MKVLKFEPLDVADLARVHAAFTLAELELRAHLLRVASRNVVEYHCDDADIRAARSDSLCS